MDKPLFVHSKKRDKGMYEGPQMTPYMHIIPYHIPFFIAKHGCFKNFSGQCVKKNNDGAKRILFQKMNQMGSFKGHFK